MPPRFEPKTAILPPAQRHIWPQLAPSISLSFVLYGGTAVALHLGHRRSIDFDFFSDGALAKVAVETSFSFMRDARVIQEAPDTLVVSTGGADEPVRLSFFGNMRFDLPELPAEIQQSLRAARDAVSAVPDIVVRPGLSS